MGMPASHTDWTVDMVHALPDDGNRYEVIDGELLVTPAPTLPHQRASAKLYLLLASYAESVGLELLYAPFAVTFSVRREVQPDLAAWPIPYHQSTPSFVELGSLALAVEILSPSTARTDRHKKRHLYQSQGVAEYWIVDVANRLIERWRPNDDEPEVLLASLVWKPNADHDAMAIDLVAYFRAVHGEERE